MSKKNLVFILIAFFTVINIQSCKKSSPIIGKWTVTKSEGALSETNQGTIYNFEDETNLVLEKDGLKNKATYKISNDTLKYSVGSVEVKSIFKITGNEMVIQNIDSDQKLTLQK